jgi:hypothetical protein
MAKYDIGREEFMSNDFIENLSKLVEFNQFQNTLNAPK